MSNQIAATVAVAYAGGAPLVEAWPALLAAADRAALAALLRGLRSCGHVAAFGIAGAGGALTMDQIVDCLSSRIGEPTVDAVRRSAGIEPPEPDPAYLLPAWAFDHSIGGRPASTAQLHGLALELTATPSPNEEVGVSLPGRPGLWLVHVRPLGL